MSSETKAKLRLAHLGLKHSAATRKKMSISQVGKHLQPRPTVTGKKNYLWKGDNAGYTAKHSWVHRWYGKAYQCENSRCTYLKPKRYEWANLSHEYRREREDWVQLCASCHRKYDLGIAGIDIIKNLTDELRKASVRQDISFTAALT